MNSSDDLYDVIVIGELNVDIILNGIEGFPAIGKEILASKMSVQLGSSSAILASNLSSLGPKVSFVGKIGKDNFANVVLTSLEKKNVDTSHIIKSASLNTGATIVLNYDQDRANVTYPGAMNELCLEDIDFDFLSKARHMHFSNFFMQPGIRNAIPDLFRRAKEMGLTTSFDTQWDPDEKWEIPLDKILPYVDIFLPNMQEFLFLTSSNTMEKGIQKIGKYAHFIVIKNGIEGATAWDGKKYIHQQAFKNDHVVDCIGAGDSFNAGFIMEFVKNKPLRKCLETGALAGAVNTTKAGGTGAFEDLEMVRKIAREKFNHTI